MRLHVVQSEPHARGRAGARQVAVAVTAAALAEAPHWHAQAEAGWHSVE